MAAKERPASELPVLDSVVDYEKLHRVGEGTYGVVYKARERCSGEVVALKKVRFEAAGGRDGVPVTSVRELRVLQACTHPNIVQLKKVVTGSKADSLFLVFEFCEHDLGRLVDHLQKPFSLSEVKCLTKQLLEAVAYLHDRWVMHRDIKMSNLLYNNRGELKLCDFGLARYFAPTPEPVTPNVVTLWYRAPEVLLGSETYDEAVDMWAVGCVLGELLRMEPLFPAEGEVECLRMHCNLLGAPNPRTWPGMSSLPALSRFVLPDQPHCQLRRTFPSLSDHGLDLLSGLLTYNPSKRLTARQALRHPFFTERPLPKQPRDMPSFPTSHAGPSGEAPPRKRPRRGGADAPQHPQQHFQHQQGLGTATGLTLGLEVSASDRRIGGAGGRRQVVRVDREADLERRFGQAFGGGEGGGGGGAAAGGRVALVVQQGGQGQQQHQGWGLYTG